MQLEKLERCIIELDMLITEWDEKPINFKVNLLREIAEELTDLAGDVQKIPTARKETIIS